MSSIEMAFTYPRELEKAKAERWPVLIPVGTMEYHSAHCPFGCDTMTAMGIVKAISEKVDCVVMPPVWYGAASYAVAGPEKNSIHVDCDTLEQYMYCILKSLFKAGFNRNIHIFICHQTEDYNPQSLACMKAARKLIFEYLEETGGNGWWGNNENAAFYSQLFEEDNPWNWIRTHGPLKRRADYLKEFKGDHAGKWECSYLEAAYPGSIKLDRLAETDDWFAQSAVEMDPEIGKRMIEARVRHFLEEIGREDLC